MLPVHTTSESESAPGGLLWELERRQDEALAEIDALEAKVLALLDELGVQQEHESLEG